MDAAPNSEEARAGVALGFAKEGWTMIQMTAREWWGDEIFRYAAALAFYTISRSLPFC